MMVELFGLRSPESIVGIADITERDDCHAILRWLEGELMGARPDGKYPQICPGLPDSIRQRALWLRPFTLSQTRSEAILQVSKWPDRFMAVPPHDAVGSKSKAIILVMAASTDRVYVQQVKNAAKAMFVSRGLMIGSFNPEESGAQVDKAKKWPPRSPRPIFAIRAMIQSDRRFLQSDPGLFDHYMKKFQR